MNARLKEWIRYLTTKYIPSSRQVAILEARRLSMFIIENYDPMLYTVLLDNIRTNLLVHTKTESVKFLDNIKDTEKHMSMVSEVTNMLDESVIIKSR